MTEPAISHKVAQVTAALRTELRAGLPAKNLQAGGRLPSMRVLAKRFAVSAFVVFQAIALLEREGLLERHPRRGVVLRNINPPAVAPPNVRLIIAEVLPWQVAFWRVVVAQAQSRGVQFELVTATSPAVLAGLIADGRPTVIANLSAASAAELPLVDMDALFRNECSSQAGQAGQAGQADTSFLTALRADLVPVAASVPQTLLPMVVQVPALIVAAPLLAPAVTAAADSVSDWPTLATWLRTALGPARMVPPSLSVIAEALGLDHALASDEVPRVLAVAGDLVRAVEALQRTQILGEPLSEPAAIAAGLRSGALGAVVRSSFLWPGFGLTAGGALRVIPLPGPQCAAIALGVGCTGIDMNSRPAAESRRTLREVREALMMLTGPEIQRLHLEHALGCSPRRSVIDAAIAQPAGLAPGMAAIAMRVRESANRPAISPRFARLMQALTDHALLPLLTGAHDRQAAERAVVDVVNTCTGRHEMLRHLLLTEV